MSNVIIEEIRLRRGPASRLPVDADDGEPIYTTDTNNIYVGAGPGVPPVKVTGVTEEIQEALADKVDRSEIGTAAAKSAPVTGNASAVQVVMGSDTRLTNSRTPNAHNFTHAAGGTDAITPADIGLGNVNNTADVDKPVSTATQAALDGKAETDDARFTNARDPLAHKSTHATGGTDALTAGDIGAAIQSMVDVRSYGVNTSGIETLTSFQSAVTAAKSAGAPLFLPPGSVVKISPSTQIDLSGIPAIYGDNVTIDVSESTYTGPIFSISGVRTAITNGLVLTEGDEGITLPAGLALQRGDILAVTSSESHPNPARTYYYKGERAVVSDYNNTTGATKVYPRLRYSYANAYIWKITETTITIPSGVKFVGKENGTQTGIRLIYANATVGAKFRHFGATAIDFTTSRGSFTGTIDDSYYTGTGTGYGVVVSDLSEISIVGATIWGCRHCVAAGGGNWNAADSGGSGGAAYPSTYTITGGTYGGGSISDTQAIDAHGIVESQTVTGATIYGGISAGGRTSNLTGNTIIVAGAQNGIIENSDMVTVGWGDLIITGNIVRSGSAAFPVSQPSFRFSGKARSLKMKGNTSHGYYGYASPLYVDGQFSGVVEIEDNALNVLSATSDPMTIYLYQDMLYKGNRTNVTMPYFRAKVAGLTLTLENNTSLNSYSYGFEAWGEVADFARVSLINNTSIGAQRSGAYVLNAVAVDADANHFHNNGQLTSASDSSRCGLAAILVASLQARCNMLGDNQVSPTQTYGVYHTPHGTLASTIDITANDATGVLRSAAFYVDAGITVKNKIGNTATNPVGNVLIGDISALNIGKKVSVPASATASGAPGHYSADTSYLYVYTGDGTTHSWRRTAIGTW